MCVCARARVFYRFDWTLKHTATLLFVTVSSRTCLAENTLSILRLKGDDGGGGTFVGTAFNSVVSGDETTAVASAGAALLLTWPLLQ